MESNSEFMRYIIQFVGIVLGYFWSPFIWLLVFLWTFSSDRANEEFNWWVPRRPFFRK